MDRWNDNMQQVKRLLTELGPDCLPTARAMLDDLAKDFRALARVDASLSALFDARFPNAEQDPEKARAAWIAEHGAGPDEKLAEGDRYTVGELQRINDSVAAGRGDRMILADFAYETPVVSPHRTITTYPSTVGSDGWCVVGLR